MAHKITGVALVIGPCYGKAVMKWKPERPHISKPKDRLAASFVGFSALTTVILHGVDTPDIASRDQSIHVPTFANATSLYPPCDTLPDPGNPSTAANPKLHNLCTVPEDTRCATALSDPQGIWEAHQLEPGDRFAVSCLVVVGGGQPIRWARVAAREPNGSVVAAGYVPVEHALAADISGDISPPACALPLAGAYSLQSQG